MIVYHWPSAVWPNFDQKMTQKWPWRCLPEICEKFFDDKTKIYFSFPLKFTAKGVKLSHFYHLWPTKCHFFKPVPNFRVLFRLLSSRFLNFCTTFFLQFIVLKIFFKNFFDNFSLLKFWIFQLWIFFQNIFVIFKKV